MNKKRWLIYMLTGLLFGIFDYYYQQALNRSPVFSSLDTIPWLTLVLGIWLVPVVPVILHEAERSRTLWAPAWASVLTWASAIVSYYLTNAAQLALTGVASRPEMHISNRMDPYFWSNWQSVFRYDILGGIREWLPVAVVGGFVVGVLMGFLYLRGRGREKIIRR